MVRLHIGLITFLVLSLFRPAFCQNQISDEKRSTIVEVDGYAYLSEDKTIRDIRREALDNARREALERASTYIKSLTTVENFQLTYDLIQSSAEGYVKILESKDNGITPDNRYHIWIKAEVEYSLQKPGNQMEVNFSKVSNAPLSVSVWTEKKEYQSDEKIRIFLQGNKDFYARVIYKDVSGNLLQILPNQHHRGNFFQGGKLYTVPDVQDNFDLEVSEPFGEEQIIVYSSTVQLGEALVDNYGSSLYQVAGNLQDFAVKTRGIKIVKKDRPAEFYEATSKILTIEK